MKTAIVTGASSGIGLAISRYLVEQDYKVYGIARVFEKCEFESPLFKQCQCDVSKPHQIEGLCSDITKEHDNKLDVLVNNAGVGYFGPFETLSTSNITEMVDVNLKAPLLFTNLLLRAIQNKEGIIINISSITAEIISRWGNAYAATKAGLLHFGDSLFDEVRKSGARVVTIQPDLTDTAFYDHLTFEPHTNPDAHLTTNDIVEAVELILNQRKGSVVTKLNLRPQKLQINKK